MAIPGPQHPEVVLVPLSQIVPDRYQARLTMPPEIKNAFYSGEVDCYEAARMLLVAADGDEGLASVVEGLRLLGHSILTERQIDPGTGTWVETNDGSFFLLETGERRFWSLALSAVLQQMREEPKLQVIPQPGNSRQRQVVENFLREDLCAVEMGRAVATMILESLDIYPEEGEDEISYFRRALQIPRLPSGTWPEIERLTGYSRPVLYRHLRILSLDDGLLYLATLYRLTEGALRDIVTAPRDRQRGLILRAIQERISEAEGSMIVGEDSPGKEKPSVSHPRASTHRRLASRILSLLKSIAGQSGGKDYDEVAVELSLLFSDPAELGEAAAIFMSLASSLKKMQSRRVT